MSNIPKINQNIVITIKELDLQGIGIADYYEYKVFVRNALPGEIVSAKIKEVVRKKIIAEVSEIMLVSNQRTPPPCNHFIKCGSCTLQHYDKYDDFKLSLLKAKLNSLNFTGKIFPLIKIPLNSRRRVTFKIDQQKISFNKWHSKESVKIEKCILLEDSINKLIHPINQLLKNLQQKIQNLSINSADNGLELIFYSDHEIDLKTNMLLVAFAREHNLLKINWQIIGKRLDLIVELNKPFIEVDKIKIPLPSSSFLQVSNLSLKVMSEIITRNLIKDAEILELFSGCGSFTIPISLSNKVESFEGNLEAVSAIVKVTNDNNLSIKANCRDLYGAPLETDYIDKFAQVIINPPRNGCTPQIKKLTATKKVQRVIIISCGIESFTRDVAILQNAGFNLDEIHPIDQFLYTGHIEIIAILNKNITPKN